MCNNEDRVRFFLPSRYFHSGHSDNSGGMCRATCVKIFRKAFDICTTDGRHLTNNNEQGFEIVCRPDQFARFIVLRYQAGECVNGIKDLTPKFFRGPIDPPDVYDEVVEQFNVPRNVAVGIARKLGYYFKDDSHCVKPKPHVVDVSDRPLSGCHE